MISNIEQQKLTDLMESNPELKSIYNKVSDENRLILSKFTHELRNPLTLIKSTIQLIESQHPEVTNYKYWNQLTLDMEDTISLLSELSVYNHCDQLQLKEINLITLLDDTIKSAEALATEKKITLNFSVEHPSLSLPYTCDGVKMKQMLINLIKNAIEAAFENTSILIKLSTYIESKTNGHYINISISNSGIPIPPENLARIFEPFVTFKSNGSGLGLAISKKIAFMHKGDISVSQTDSAITFTIQLPTDVVAMKPLYIAL